jgi:hypothetical protein
VEQNSDARALGAAHDGIRVEQADVPLFGGEPVRLNGTPIGLLSAWRDASKLLTDPRAGERLVTPGALARDDVPYGWRGRLLADHSLRDHCSGTTRRLRLDDLTLKLTI